MTDYTLELGEGMATAAHEMKDRYVPGFPQKHDCGSPTKRIEQDDGTITFYCPQCEAGVWNGKPEMLAHFKKEDEE